MRRFSIIGIAMLAATVAVVSPARPSNASARWVVGGMRTVHASRTDPAHGARRALTFLFGMRAVQARTAESAAGSPEAFAFRDGITGMASAITVYVDLRSRATRLLVGLYLNRDGKPGSRLATGSIDRPKAGAWNRVHLSPTPVKAGKTYWVAVMGKGGRFALRKTPRGRCAAQGSRRTIDASSSLTASWAGGLYWRACSMSAYVSGIPSGLTFGPITTTGTPSGGATTVSVTTPSNPAAPLSPPVNAVAPAISGTPQQGQMLTVSNGSWTNSPSSYGYQWQDCSVELLEYRWCDGVVVYVAVLGCWGHDRCRGQGDERGWVGFGDLDADADRDRGAAVSAGECGGAGD